MTIQDLATTLAEMYHNAPKGEKYPMIYLFAIKYADIITENKYSKTEILERAGISEKYATELNKAIKLSKYVSIK